VLLVEQYLDFYWELAVVMYIIEAPPRIWSEARFEGCSLSELPTAP